MIPGPPTQVEVTISDTGSGLQSILVTKSQNADTVVPPFSVGTVADIAGNEAICDPILTMLVKDAPNVMIWDGNGN